MLQPDTKVRITVYDGNGGQVTLFNRTVTEYKDGLLKVADHKGKETIFNMRSLGFFMLEMED